MDEKEIIISLQSQWENVLKRDEIFTNLLSNFAEHQKNRDKEQQKQKKVFFWMVCISFFVVIIGCITALIIIALIKEKSWEDFGVALGSVVSLISVIIVLPSKIAEHLFPADGEKDITAFFIRSHERDMMINQENALGESAYSTNENEYESFSELLSALDESKVEET